MSLLIQSELQGLLDQAMKERGQLRTGNNYKYHCPFCHHRKRKLEVNLDSYVWHCWTCDAKGKSIYSLFKKMRVPASTTERLKKILPIESKFSRPADPTFTPFAPKVAPIEKPTLQLPEEFRSLLDPDKSFAYQAALRYARKRNLTKWDIIKYNIGYCPDGEYRDRLIFPSYDSNNQLNFFTGRSYYDDSGLKYKNVMADRNIIGFENLVDFDYPIALCEGALDAIAIKKNAVPLFGKMMSPKLKQSISKNRNSEVFIVLDDDALPMAIRHAEFLLTNGKTVRLVNLQGHDPSVLGFVEINRQMRETPILGFSDLMKLKLKLKLKL